MYSELLGVIRVTTARISIGTNTIYSTLWPWGYQNITVGPQQLPHYVPRHFLASTAYSKDESPARPSRLCDRRSRLTTLSRHLVPMALRSPQQSCA